jgi:hypothetical protein
MSDSKTDGASEQFKLRMRGTISPFLHISYPEDVGNIFLQIAGIHVPDCTVS